MSSWAIDAPKVKFTTTAGDFVVEVYPDKAPKTVENFLQYVKDKHYDGTIFHRVIGNFIIQGGGYDAKFAQKTTRAPVVHEGRGALAKGGARNVMGTLAMATTSDPQSATAQFFINVNDNHNLDPTSRAFGSTVFGKVISGKDVVNSIRNTRTGAGGPFSKEVPQTQILIVSAALVNNSVLSQQPEKAIDTTVDPSSSKVTLSQSDAMLALSFDRTKTDRATSTHSPSCAAFEAHDFYGECDANGRAKTGLVVWKLSGIPTDIRCLSNGAYQDTIGEFDACAPYWPALPNYCAAGDYKGECENGAPNGVGFRHKVTYTHIEVKGILGMFAGMAPPQEAHETFRGMFKNGELDGSGTYFAISGCGRVGCSGERVNQKGWFEKGTFKFDCGNAFECSKKVSGSAFTAGLKSKAADSKVLTTSPPLLQGTFESHIRDFEDSGSPRDLKKAQSLAKTKAQQSILEFNILRTAGFEKGLSLSARASNGNNSIGIRDAQGLLGFFRSVESSIPVKINWNINPVNSVVQLKHGVYRVRVRVGITVKSTNRTCRGEFCQNRDDVKTYAQTFDAVLAPRNAYRAQGVYDLSISGSSSAMVLGSQSLSEVTALEPVISIETVELSQ